MAAPEVHERIRAVRLSVDRTIDLLLSPSPAALDRCSEILETAGRQLAEFQPLLEQSRGTAAAFEKASRLEEARKLRWSVVRANRLLDGAAKFHDGWCRLRDSLTAGYTDRGAPAPTPARRRILVHG